MGDAQVTASNWRLVEVGRVAEFAKGPYTGRLVAIVQIIDHKRVLVEGPSEKSERVVPRHAAPLSHLSLTSIVIPKITFGVGHTALKKQWESHDVEGKFYSSAYAKGKAQLQRRRQLSDFERFKVMVLRKQARFETRKQLASAKGKA